ncbi:PEP/pyruvate-binding domain-containing protein [Chitinimonas sp.]|uniref:PEP/pyruvate-binding domain-containing protein n=1 Tax=Chitinimonas sp. TaxID=1934313 RepID=UPI0035B10F3D
MSAAISTPILLDWPAAAAAGPQQAGGKGWQLGLLARYGLPVPAGAVLPVAAYRQALAAASIDPAQLLDEDGDLDRQLAACHERLRQLPLPASLTGQLQIMLAQHNWQDQALAVRSSAPMEDSAGASFAGIHQSCLNVLGFAALCDAIREVWASLWTPQAYAYRQRLGLSHHDCAMAVVIMPLLPATAAGIAFSIDPRSGRDDHLLIHAQWGLGEALVSGATEGDEYLVQEDPLDARLSLLARKTGAKTRQTQQLAGGGTITVDTPAQLASQAVLADAQITQLAGLVRDAAQALDFAEPFYDVEWVWDGLRFWLVQARPITAMARYTYPQLRNQPSIWTNGNTRDVVPLPLSALDWCHGRRWINAVLAQSLRHAGYPALPGLQRCKLFHGRLYLNASIMQFEAWDAFGFAPQAFNQMMGGHQPEITPPPARLGDKLRRLPYILRYLAAVLPLRRRADAIAAKAEARAASLDQHRIPDDNLAAARYLEQLFREMRSQLELGFLQVGSGAGLAMLVDRLERNLPGQGHALAAALLAGGTPSITAQQGYELIELAALANSDAALKQWLTSDKRDEQYWQTLPEQHPFRRGFARFLAQYGHRGVYESYWRYLRWHDHPGQLLDHIAGLLGTDPAALKARQQASQADAWTRLRRALPWWKRLGLAMQVKAANQELGHRELARSRLIMLKDATRQQLWQLAPRLQAMGALREADQLADLTLPEMLLALRGQISGPALARRIEDRQQQSRHWQAQTASDVILQGEGQLTAPAASIPASKLAAGQWQGVAIGAGSIRGRARIILHPADGKRLQQGEILVCPSTDPAWTPLFLKAGGLVMETGGYLSHGAIVAREFGLPAVVNLPGILQQIRDGQMVEVDGHGGVVTLLD